MFARVDKDLCRQIAFTLKTIPIPEDVEDTSIGELSKSETCDFYLMLVAICHQTQALKGTINGELKRGWDFLRLKLLAACVDNRDILRPKSWCDLSVGQLQEIMRDEEHGDTLSNVAARVDLINDLGLQFRKSGWDNSINLFDEAGGDCKEALGLLSQSAAYNDPVQKKAFFYLGLISNSKAYALSNFEEVGAPVDYHEVRGHLRLGTVILDFGLATKLRQRETVTVEEDVAIRSSVHSAIRSIADDLSISPMRLHYLFWNLFRNICLREDPLCRQQCESLPERYAHFSKSGCPFCVQCKSVDTKPKLLEHTFSTDWY